MIKDNGARREPYSDGCEFNPPGVVCKDKAVHDCSRCGWFPPEAKRRIYQIRAYGKCCIRREVTK